MPPTRREIIEPRNCAGLITKAVRVEVAEVGAGFGQYLVGMPD